jgi:hypothetical protein
LAGSNTQVSERERPGAAGAPSTPTVDGRSSIETSAAGFKRHRLTSNKMGNQGTRTSGGRIPDIRISGKVKGWKTIRPDTPIF